MPRGIQKGNKAVKPRVYLEDHCAASLGRQIKGTRKSEERLGRYSLARESSGNGLLCLGRLMA